MTSPIYKKIVNKIFVIAAMAYLAVSPALAVDVIGKFPSLLGSDGARAIDEDIVWLGESRDKEGNSKQVDADTDDGISPEFNSCAPSRANFIVHVKKPGKTEGVAYLNLWADWNRDGQWSGSDKCAKEWAVRNYEIDLSKQTDDLWIYAPEFIAGATVKDIWYRGVVSYNEKLVREDGGGEFAAGEVEDYGPVFSVSLEIDDPRRPRRGLKDYSLACAPQPVALNHGESAEFTVGPAFVGSEKPNSTGFSSKNGGLNAGGTSVTTTNGGDITKKPKNPNQFGDPNNPFVYTSTEVHLIGGTTRDSVVIEATYADGHISEATCTIFVWHPPGEIPGPGPRVGPPIPAPEEDRGHNIIFTFLEDIGTKQHPPSPPFVPPPPAHNYLLTVYEKGKKVVQDGAEKVRDAVTGGSKEQPPVIPPQPPTPQPPVEPPLHDDISTAIHDDVLSEFIDRQTPDLFPPQHSTWRSLFLPPKPPEEIEHSINLSKYVDARVPPLFGGSEQFKIPQVETFGIFNLPPLIQWIFPPTPEPTVTYTPDGRTTVGSGGEIQFEPRSPLEEWPSVVCDPSPLAINHGGSGTINLSVNDPLGADPNSVKMRGSPSNLGKRAGNALVWKYSDFVTADGQGKVRLADNPYLDDQHPYKPSITFYSTEVHDIGMAVSSSFDVTLDYRLGKDQGYREQSVTGTCSVVVTHPPKEPTTPTHDTQKSRITETPTGGEPGEDQKQPVPQPVPPTETPNFLQRILNLPPLLQLFNIIPAQPPYEGEVFFPPVPPGGNDTIGVTPGTTFTPPSGDRLPPIPTPPPVFTPPSGDRLPPVPPPTPPGSTNIQGPTYSEEGRTLPPLKVFVEPFKGIINQVKTFTEGQVEYVQSIGQVIEDFLEDSAEKLESLPPPGPENYIGARRIRELIFGSGTGKVTVLSDIAVGPDDIISPTGLKRVEIILPAPERIFTLPSPTKPLEDLGIPISPFNFLSQRLLELSNDLIDLVSSAPPATDITQTNPRCLAVVSEDANQDNSYKFEAACRNYKSCSVSIRNLTAQGSLVSEKVLTLPANGELIARDRIPTSAAVAVVSSTCNGTTYSSFAHTYKAAGAASPSTLSITTSSLADGTVNTSYSQTVSGQGGTLQYTWSVSAGSLPAGLSIAAGTGVISGTPTTAATSNFTITVTDANGLTASRALSIVVSSAALSITTTSPLATATGNCTGITAFAATGGTSPYTWSLSSLNAVATANSTTVDANTGQLSCTIIGAGTAQWITTVTDAVSGTATLNPTIQQQLP